MDENFRAIQRRVCKRRSAINTEAEDKVNIIFRNVKVAKKNQIFLEIGGDELFVDRTKISL